MTKADAADFWLNAFQMRYVTLHVCVSERERKRGREREGGREGGMERLCVHFVRECMSWEEKKCELCPLTIRECVCVCAHVSAYRTKFYLRILASML